jgi:hypothetical protein
MKGLGYFMPGHYLLRAGGTSVFSKHKIHHYLPLIVSGLQCCQLLADFFWPARRKNSAAEEKKWAPSNFLFFSAVFTFRNKIIFVSCQ